MPGVFSDSQTIFFIENDWHLMSVTMIMSSEIAANAFVCDNNSKIKSLLVRIITDKHYLLFFNYWY